MFVRQSVVLVIGFLGCAFFGHSLRASPDDHKAITGIWQLVAGERQGNKFTADDLQGANMVFTSDQMTVNIKGRSVTYPYCLFPDRSPKAIEIKLGGQTGAGLYELTDNHLRIIHGEVGGEPPTSLGPTAGTEFTLLELQRFPASEFRSILELVEQIKRADYEGDRDALRQLHESLATYAANETYGDKVLYWQGFALWRRAINGFNENVERAEQEADLNRAIQDFEAALANAPEFSDARVGIIGCTSLLLYLDYQPGNEHSRFGNEAQAKERIARVTELAKSVTDTQPDHPRLLWVRGPSAMANGDAAKAMEMYSRARTALAASSRESFDPLMPTWGDPEILMNQAYTMLHQNEPDLAGAEKAARAALAMVPHWHYVKDILLPQILDAKSKHQSDQ